MRVLKFKDLFKKVDVNFADFLSPYNEAKYVLFGVPFDATSTHRKGSFKAPERIREESYNFETFVLEAGLDISSINMADIGDVKVENSQESQVDLVDVLYFAERRIIMDKKIPLIIGGEHSITPPSVDAFSSVYQNSFFIVLDAHLDYREEFEDNSLSHACTNRRVSEVLGEENMVVIGVRSMSEKEYDDAQKNGLNYLTSWRIKRNGIEEILNEIIEKKNLQKREIYLSIDMDVVDPSFAPGVGNPEPWGITPWDILQMISILGPFIKAIDLTEVNPSYDVGNTSSLAARLIRSYIAFNWKSIINR